MNKILTDFDGVLLRSEFVKAYEWFIASLRIQGNDKVTDDFIKQLETGKVEALKEAERMCKEDYADEFHKIEGLAGGSRDEVMRGVWKLSGYTGSEYKPEDLREIRVKLKKSFEGHFSERIEGNIRFFQKARQGGLELGLVTQAKEGEIKKLSAGKGLCLDNIFSGFECVGDYSSEKKDAMKSAGRYKDLKSYAYENACSLLGANPDNIFAFEDSDKGIAALNAVGIVSIGIKDEKNKQELSNARLTVYSDLGVLANNKVMKEARCLANPNEVISYFHEYFQNRGVKSELRG